MLTSLVGEQTISNLLPITAQFVIVAASRLHGRAAGLANQRGVTVITLPEYRQGQPLPAPAVNRLVSQNAQRLGGRSFP